MGGAQAFIGPAVQVLALAASVALQIALAPKGPNEEGPRLNNLRATSAAYGEDIPVGYGRVRLGAKIIWSDDILEVRSKKKTGGKGALFAKGGSTTQYKYYGSFAAAFAEGPSTCITRIFADRKVIYDITGASEGFYKYPGSTVRFYDGDETQLPDPLIQADQGVGATPAYRGTVYLVFENLPLEDFGNRLPTLEAEIDFLNSPTAPQQDTTNMTATTDQVFHMEMMRANRQLYGCRFNTGGRAEIFRVDMETNDQVAVVEQDTPSASSPYLYESELPSFGLSPEGIYPWEDGKLFVQGVVSGGIAVVQLNPYDLSILDTGVTTDFDIDTFSQGPTLSFAFVGPQGIKNFTLFFYEGDSDTQSLWALWDRENNEYARVAYIGKTDAQGGYHEWGPTIADRDGNVWVAAVDRSIAADGSGRKARLMRFKTIAKTDIAKAAIGAALGTVNQVAGMLFDSQGIVYDFDIDEYDLTQFGINAPVSMTYDEANHHVILLGDEDTTPEFRVSRIDLNTITEVEGVNYDGDTPADRPPVRSGGNVSMGRSGPANGKIYYDGETFTRWAVTMSDLSIEQLDDYDPDRGGFSFLDRDTNTVYRTAASGDTGTAMSRLQYDRCPFVAQPLEDVLQEIFERTEEFTTGDVTYDAGILAQDVRGYTQPGRQSVRKLLEALLVPFNFEVAESGGLLRCVSRGGASARTITKDDLGARPASGTPRPEGASDLLETARAQEFEIPREMSFTYFDFDRDQQEGTQYDKRNATGDQTQDGRDTVTVQAPILFTADEGAQVAEKALYALWVARTAYKYSLGPKHMDLDPTDIVTIEPSTTESLLTRIGKTDLGDGYASRITAASEDSEVYTSSALGETVSVAGSIIVLPGGTEPLLLDIPLLQDSDDGIQRATGVYVNFGAYRSSWTSASIDRTDGGGSGYKEFSVSRDEAPWGYLVNAVPAITACPEPGATQGTTDYPYQINGWDRIETIVIFIVEGEDKLNSVTELQALNGENTMVIGNGDTAEILSVVDILDNGDGTFDLTTLLRGRRGTEPRAIEGHAAGTQITFMDQDWTNREPIALNRIGEPDTYRSTTVGQVAEDALQRSLTNQGNDVRPYPVAMVRTNEPSTGQDRNPGVGSLVLTWTRRTRLGAEDDLLDTIEDVPLGETLEEYEVDLIQKAVNGTATAGSGQNTLIDTGASFDNGDIQVGDLLSNTTQTLDTRVVSIDSATQITTGNDPDGTVTWATSDAYVFADGPVAVAQTGLTTETATFTNTDIYTTAGYADTDLVLFRIYQKSAVGGRGLVKEVLI